MEILAPIISRSPRAIKRFVNIYRLIKTMLPEHKLRHFLADSDSLSPYKAVMLLLAVITGTPHISRRFFQVLNRSDELLRDKIDQEPDINGLVVLLDQLSEEKGSTALNQAQRIELARLEAWSAGADHGAVRWNLHDLSEMALLAESVARYSFRIDLADHHRPRGY